MFVGIGGKVKGSAALADAATRVDRGEPPGWQTSIYPGGRPLSTRVAEVHPFLVA